MNILKKLPFIIVVAFLASCSTTKDVKHTQFKAISAKSVSLKNAKISDAEKLRWSHLDIEKDTIPGMSVDRAYAELLKEKKGKKVIVAVIDSGTDIEHEDLQGVIWTNPKEIPGNGIDDDKNGYIDDIHGWNFLGDAVHETLEMTRIVKKGDDGSETYKKAKETFDEKRLEAMQIKMQVDFMVNADKALKKHFQKDIYTLEDIKTISTTDTELGRYKLMMMQILENTSKEEFDQQLEKYVDYAYDQVNYHLNLEFDGRKLTGDNPDDINDRNYGNNNVIGPDKKQADHGTHVSGIIAQVRHNNLGGDGVANNVEIMALRAVPNGDEYDKDIALAIRYAADNGAKVINGSFGKGFSPHKEWVYDAIKYAASKDVLIVHAAGNDGANIDIEENFPDDQINGKEISDNFISIGALNFEYGVGMIAVFSNYGKQNVDVFSPGVEIYATTPNNTYRYEQGTSMASPNVAGVAALIRSYYPDLTAFQVKKILMDSGVSIEKEVNVPGEQATKLPFKDLSKSGKIINAYNALLMAEQISIKK
ncbi:MAG TPA: S8 family peptidase [Flavobacterium sp.]|nr:S8 family peptidase [Flavobacterium sp.]